MYKKIVAAARHAGAVFLLAFAGSTSAAVQMLLPPSASTKAMPTPPRDIRSTALPVHFNAEELLALPLGSEVELTLPNATTHTFVFDQKRDHGDGNVTWVGYYRDRDQRLKMNAVITVGPTGTIGSIQTPAGEFAIRHGAHGTDWLVDLKAEQPKADLANDARPIALSPMKKTGTLASPDFADVIPGTTVPLSDVLPTSAQSLKVAQVSTVDMLLVYNDSLAVGVGNISTFAAQLQSEANTAYSNSGVNINLHIVATMRLAYSDATDNGTALDDITGSNSSGQIIGSANNTAIEAMRAQVGADLVAFYRGGDGATLGGSNFGQGLAWVPTSPMAAGWKPYMYSSTIGCWGGCEFIWIHEVGHNMGNMHDRATNFWETGGAPQGQNGNNGSYAYSWGFYTCNGRYDDTVLSCPAFGGGCASQEPRCASNTNAFHDLMAYFHGNGQPLRLFSNPSITCTGSNPALPCGLADLSTDPNMPGRQDSSNLALSMNNNAVALSGLVATVSGGGTGTATTTTVASNYNPAQVGSAFTFTGTVTSTGGIPSGSMTFKSNGTTVGGCSAIPVNPASGIAFCTATGLPAGALSITVQFTGTGGFADSTSAVLTQNMVAIPSVIAGMPRKVDFDGDGKSDLGWRGPGGLWGVWLMAGASYSPTGTAYVTPPQTGSVMRAVGDFDGDGKTDILWRNPDNSYSVTLMNGTSQGAPIATRAANSGFDVVAVGDFNADGKADLLWAGLNGQFQVTLMNAGAPAAPVVLAAPASGYSPAMVGDFNADGRADLLWRAADGSLVAMLLNGTANAGMTTLVGGNTGWFPTHMADFNADGKADILLAKADGSVALWLMNGLAIGGGAILQDTHGVPNGWSVTLARDLDGDGKADLVWVNAANGTYGGWLMDGAAVKPNGYGTIFNVANSGWSIVASGDYNFDAHADLMWKHTNGQFSTWIMNGFNAIAYGSVLGAGTGWDLAP